MRLRIAVLVTIAAFSVGSALGADADAGLEFFESKIRPVLVKNCYACHSAEAKVRMGGLSLDTRDGMREGGLRGHAVVPNDAESSVLVGALRYQEGLKMPPTGKLSDEVVANFVEWIEMGAPDPRQVEAKATGRTIDLEKGRQFWAFQAPRKEALPATRDLNWAGSAIDQFVLAGMEERGLRPAPDATKESLLRRVTFDLTGLPPTPEEIEAFLADDSPSAYRRVVDDLLESERFGERWGRHWLDIVRYADSTGRTRNLPYPVAWKYRDYVINAFNEDKPYDRFVQQQIAGDLLPAADPRERIENQIATGFLAIGAYDLNEPDAKQFDMDVADEMINVSTRSLLALSVGCARCHDHKFDPIPTKDYYSLAAIFRNSDLRTGLRRRPRFNAGYFRAERLVTLEGMPAFTGENAASRRDESDGKRAELLAALAEAEAAADRTECRRLARELGKLPLPENLAMGVVERDEHVKMRVNIGGDPHTLGDPVQAGFVQALFPADADLPSVGGGASGRLELAQWLTRRDNPLTARVMANRVWHHLFGKGLVATVDNFGATGRQPTNRALLDYLAVQFMDQGWSVKNLIREVVSSRAYRLSTQFDAGNFETDPDNDYLWRANMRRLEAESVRDAILLVSGELETDPGMVAPVYEMDRNQLITVRSRQLRPWEVEESYRSIYVPVIRNEANRLFEAFDFPEPSETHGARDVTTGPAQALFLMNNGFVRSHAGVAAERLLARRSDDRERVGHAFRQVLSRDPTEDEVRETLSHVRDSLAVLASDGAESERSEAQAWLGSLLSEMLEREPEENEMEAAMDYVLRSQPGADQSLAAMEDAFVDDKGGIRSNVTRNMFRNAVGRRIGDREREAAEKALQEVRERKRAVARTGRQVWAGPASPEHEAWMRLYHALFNSAEFRYRN